MACPVFAQNAASIEDVYFNSQPSGGVYHLGSTVEVWVLFSRPVHVTGSPSLALEIGTTIRHASFHEVDSGQWLTFWYYVADSDRDDDGISIPANALTLNGGTIKDADGNDADLNHDAVPDDPYQQVDGSRSPAAPTVAVDRVRFFSLPLLGDTYGPDEEIRALVNFSNPVTVTGNLELTLRIGDQTRRADLHSRGGDYLYFRHFVEESDSDVDGISIPANAVLLNGGSIRDSQGNDVDLTHEAVPDDARRKVNGRLDVLPTITRVAPVYSQSDTVGRGEPLLVLVEFSELIEVTGTPQLTLQVGSQPRQADFHLRRNSSLFFEYFVRASDVDTDGISVPADALTLNGGSIRDAHGNDADLTHEAVPDDPERKVNGAPTVSLAVERVYFSRPPASQDTYEAGETIVARVRFTRGIHVTGTPQLALQVGAQERRADHFSRLEAAAFLPPSSSYHLPADQDDIAVFRYVVQPSDADDDGISVPANALTLNGGSIRAVDDNSEADLGHDGLPDDPTRRVDGSRADDHAPAVQSGWIEPPTHGAFRTGDAITVRLRFSESVAVTGAPGIALRIGEATRLATVTESWESTTLLFEYIVEESDRDDDGLSITADAVDLNGGTIKDNAGNDANLDLGYFPFDNDPNLKVNPPQLTPVPALPLGGVLVLVLALLGAAWRSLTRVNISTSLLVLLVVVVATSASATLAQPGAKGSGEAYRLTLQVLGGMTGCGDRYSAPEYYATADRRDAGVERQIDAIDRELRELGTQRQQVRARIAPLARREHITRPLSDEQLRQLEELRDTRLELGRERAEGSQSALAREPAQLDAAVRVLEESIPLTDDEVAFLRDQRGRLAPLDDREKVLRTDEAELRAALAMRTPGALRVYPNDSLRLRLMERDIFNPDVCATWQLTLNREVLEQGGAALEVGGRALLRVRVEPVAPTEPIIEAPEREAETGVAAALQQEPSSEPSERRAVAPAEPTIEAAERDAETGVAAALQQEPSEPSERREVALAEPIIEAAERGAVEAGVAAALQRESDERRRSMARTWGGIGLLALGLLMPFQQETCVTVLGFEVGCVTEFYTPGLAAGVSLTATGVMLATVWSDVPAAPSVDIGPGRIGVSKTLAW